MPSYSGQLGRARLGRLRLGFSAPPIPPPPQVAGFTGVLGESGLGSFMLGEYDVTIVGLDARVTQIAIEFVYQASVDVRVTQVPWEILAAYVPAARVTQTSIELLYTKGVAARITQGPIEVLSTFVPKARVTQTEIEFLFVSAADARVTQTAIEVFYTQDADARVTQTSIEVLYQYIAPVDQFKTDGMSVAQAITHSSEIIRHVQDSIGVAQNIAGIDYPISVETDISVSQTVYGRNAENKQTVSSTIGVTDLPRGRSNIIHMSVTSTLNVANPAEGKDSINRQNVNQPVGILDIPTERSDNPRISAVSVVFVNDTTLLRNTMVRIPLTTGVTVTETIFQFLPNFQVTSSGTVAETIAFRSNKPRITVTETISVAQVIRDHNTQPRITVTDNVEIPQFSTIPPVIVARNSINRQAMYEFPLITETIAANSTRQRVTDTVTVTHDFRKNLHEVLMTEQIAVNSHFAGGNSRREISVFDFVGTNDTGKPLNSVQRISVSMPIRVIPDILDKGPIVQQDVEDSIEIFTSEQHTVLPYFHVSDHFEVHDFITIGLGNKRVSFTDTCQVTQTIRASPIVESVTSTIVVTQRIQQLEIEVKDRVHVSQIANRKAEFRLSQSITFTEDLVGQKIMTHTLNDLLQFNEQLDRSMVWGRTLTDQIIFPDAYYIRATSIDPNPIQVPIAVGTIVSAKTVVLTSGPGRAIVMPAPQFDDSIGNVIGITIKRTMNGGTYSFVKSSDRQKLIWTFKIAQSKAIELRTWIIASISELIDVTDWKGRVWKARMTTNPTTLSADGRFAPEHEYTMVELQFDAVKISG